MWRIVAAAVFACLCTVSVASTPLPNVILILADDLGAGDLGATGNSLIHTPRIDSLARDGMQLTQFYAAANVCTPSRAALLTGRYAIRSGLAWKVVSADDTRGLPHSETTLAELARSAGYATALVGKWHLGNLQDYSPLDHGFDEFFGVPHSNDMPGFHLFEGRKAVETEVDQRTLTRRYTERALQFIQSNQHRPFFLMLSHTMPHIPLYASDAFTGRSAAGTYGDVVEELDWSTGAILDALSGLHLDQNTLIIFTSDNGPFFEGSTGELRGGKGNTLEGGYRVPMLARWPARITAGTRSAALTSQLDVLPTLAEIMGADTGQLVIDGNSIVPLFKNPAAQVNTQFYYFDNEDIVGVRTSQWKYLTHRFYRGSLGAFEKFAALPGFAGAYDLLYPAHPDVDERYSLASTQPQAPAA